MKQGLRLVAVLTALSALAVVGVHTRPIVSAQDEELRVPERGFVSSEPADSWEQGLLSGNGSIGASVFGRPLDETVVFSHKRMFVPERPPLLPPPTGERLFEIRRLIDRGLYEQAARLARSGEGGGRGKPAAR